MESKQKLLSSRIAPGGETEFKRKSSSLGSPLEEKENQSPNSPSPSTLIKKAKLKVVDTGNTPQKENFRNIDIASTVGTVTRKKSSLPRFASKGKQVASKVTESTSASSMHNEAKVARLPKRSRKSLLRITTGGRIKNCFERAEFLTEEKINDIIKPKLKAKNKWDFKDKAKRQEEVIMELKSAIKSTMDEFKQVKENCESEENIIEENIRDLKQELESSNQQLAEIRQAETCLKKEYIRVCSEHSSVVGELKSTQNEVVRLENALSDERRRINILDSKLISEVERRIACENTLENLIKENVGLKEALCKSEQLQRDQEKANSQLIAEYRERISALTSDLGRRRSDIEKIEQDRVDLEISVKEINEQNNILKTNNTQLIFANQKLTDDLERLNKVYNELCCTHSQTNLELSHYKESIHEANQKNAEEKGELRGELCALRQRLEMIEMDRLKQCTEVALKNEEIELLKKKVNTVEDKLVLQQSLVFEKDKLFSEQVMQLHVEKELRERCEEREKAEREERIAACAQLRATESEYLSKCKAYEEKLQVEQHKFFAEFNQLQGILNEHLGQIRLLTDTLSTKEAELVELKKASLDVTANQAAASELGRYKGEVEILRRHLEELIHEKKNEDFIFASKIKDLEGQLWKSDVQRRKLHNLVQELRGNVRVFARVRPLLPTDETDNYASTVLKVAQNDTGIKIARRTNEMSSDKSEEHLFNFDRVFGPSVSQEMVFNEVSEFVQSALDGYNVCLFSYGQTGSGKTHTMLGTGYGDSPMRGIIPRAIEQIGKYKQGLESKGWTYQMEASFIEIYNENIKDLLRSTAKDDLKHEIKKDPSGFTVISDTTLINVNPCDQTQIQQILLTAARQRSVGSTAMNANSSRSHSIFTLYLRAANETEGLMLNGCLNLVDLAGSERLDKSQAMGDRLKEAVAINKSLSSLTDVFLAISNKQSHVPFRNSKLTHFLQPSLSGDGKTLMIINLSPVEESYFETLCTLRFGSQVNQCELGKPKRMLGQPVNSNSSTVNATGTSKQCSNPKRKVSEKEVTISKR